jgi:hypothetical protein
MAGAAALPVLGLLSPAESFSTLARDCNTLLFFRDDRVFRAGRGLRFI